MIWGLINFQGHCSHHAGSHPKKGMTFHHSMGPANPMEYGSSSSKSEAHSGSAGSAGSPFNGLREWVTSDERHRGKVLLGGRPFLERVLEFLHESEALIG